MNTTRSIFAAACIAVLAGCTGGDGDHSGTVQGQVTDNPGFGPISGAVVTAFEVRADGSLHAVSDGVTTDAQGHYSLVVHFASETISDFVVEAQSASIEGRAIVSAELHAGGTVTAPPIDGQTSIEADVYLEARAGFESGVTTEGLRAMIDSSTALALEASASYESDVAACADSIVLGLRARARMLVNGSVGATQSQVEAFLSAEAAAQAALDAALSAGGSPSEIDAALQLYAQAVIEGQAEAGIAASQYASAIEAQAFAMVSAGASLSTGVQSQARILVERAKAEAIGRAHEAAFAALGASGAVMSGVQSARLQLDAALSASAGSSAVIQSSWSNYSAYIRGEIEAQLDVVVSGGGSAVDGVQSTFTAAHATLSAALTAAGGSVDGIVAAYGSFDAAIENSIRGDGTLGGMTEAQIEATARVLASTTLNGG